MRACLPFGNALPCQKDLSWAGWPHVPPLGPLLQKSGFQGLFSRAPENRLVRDRHTRLAAAAILSRFARRSRSPALPLDYPGVEACYASPRCFIGPQSAGVSRRRHLAQVRDALDVLLGLPCVAQAQQPECCRVRRGCTQVHFLPDLQLSGSRGGRPPRSAVRQREPCANTVKPRVRRLVGPPRHRATNEHPPDVRRVLENREDSGLRGSFRRSAACMIPWYSHGFSTSRPR
jgi:hypothetical protein